jgi:hypothetical protein
MRRYVPTANSSGIHCAHLEITLLLYSYQYIDDSLETSSTLLIIYLETKTKSRFQVLSYVRDKRLYNRGKQRLPVITTVGMKR